jgi:lysophospholipid acyltransferase (LPLAT)-like uncharacterized protein
MSLSSKLASIKVIFAGTLAWVLISVLSRLVRWSYVFPADRLADSEKVIIAFWHGRILMMPWLYSKLERRSPGLPYMLISQHGDGRIIALAARLLGIRSVAGSSTRGGLKALLQLIKVAREGSDIGFTPDGPRGPRYQVKQGILLAAAKTGSPIIPCTYSSDRRWQLRSWDGMIIPKPFSRGVCMVGEPIAVAEWDDYEAARLRVQDALNDLTKRADEYWSNS